jgi:thiol-disulfide isomerase/thioredoxin
MANEILKAEGAPAGAKTLAQHILKGTRPYRLGAPVDIRFTAMDGQEVDLAKLKGKVVLVNFWSTTCGPCLAELPALKAAYERWHPQGFEIVGIALDDKEGPLRRFIKEKGLVWPQHFDGKGWGSQFAMKYGVFSIPTMWLVDQQGNLRDVNARGNLEGRIKALLNDSAGPARVTK